MTKNIINREINDSLVVTDTKLGGVIKEKLGIQCVSDNVSNELVRGIRSQLEGLITELNEGSLNQMSLGLAHSLSRYKLKFSPDKVDTMIVQAIGISSFLQLISKVFWTIWIRN